MTKKKRGVRFVLLVEDKSIGRIFTSVLKSFGFSAKQFRIFPAPDGEGSAEKWVTDQYPDYVKKHQSQNHQKNIVLLVGTDADKKTVELRIQNLAKSLSESKVSERTPEEKIVLWIPKWNIETWILHLSDEKVNEDINGKVTKQRVKKMKPNFKVLGAEFVTRYHKFLNEETQDLLPSLKTAFEETKERLPLER